VSWHGLFRRGSALSLAECGNGDDLQSLADRHADDDDESFVQELERERQLAIQAGSNTVSAEDARGFGGESDEEYSDDSIPIDSGESTSFEDSMMRATANSSFGDGSPR